MELPAPDLRVKKLHPEAVLPCRSYEDDAGLDLRVLAGGLLRKGEIKAFCTGLAVEIPCGYAGLVLPRSGLATKSGVTVVNAPGLIDPGYRGEVQVALINHGPSAVRIEQGNRVAQLLVVPFSYLDVVEVEYLTGSERGDGGFGSTGKA